MLLTGVPRDKALRVSIVTVALPADTAACITSEPQSTLAQKTRLILRLRLPSPITSISYIPCVNPWNSDRSPKGDCAHHCCNQMRFSDGTSLLVITVPSAKSPLAISLPSHNVSACVVNAQHDAKKTKTLIGIRICKTASSRRYATRRPTKPRALTHMVL